MQFEIDPKVACSLRLISIRMQWHREVRLEILYRNGFVILNFQPLRPEREDGNDSRAEDRCAFCFFGAAFAHLQQAGIDVLRSELVVDFLRALALQNDGGNARWSVPGSKVGNSSAAGKRKDVV